MKKFQSSHAFFSHLYILTIFLAIFVSCRCPEHQKSALLNIFSNRSALPSWRDDASSDDDCCQWEGITCDDVSAHVIGLDVTNRSISASLNSSALSSLRSLRFLNLSSNDFRDSIIPSNLDSLSNLTHLNLSFSNFTGQIPAAIARMTNLVVLDLSDYGLKLERPSAEELLRNLSRLTKLHLDGVDISSPTLDMSGNSQLSGSLPDSFRNLSHLTQLHLSVCEFSGQIPPSLLNLTRLAVLDLSNNNFSGWIPPLDSSKSIGDHGGLRDLEVLDLSFNSLYGAIPSYLFTLPSLKGLYLHSNQLEGELPEFSNASSTLEAIYLSRNKLHGRIPISIFGFRRLQSLVMLDLSQNSLVVNANYVDTSPFPRLQYLGLSSCNLRQFPHFLRRQLEMVELDLSDNEIAGEIPSWLWTVGGGTLVRLNLSGNSLTSLQQPYNLSSNGFLEVLDLNSNQLQGELPLPLSSIRVLDCSKNNFTTIIPSELASRLVSAQFFSISGNNISGEIPPSICNASYLEVLDLSDNSLSGSIPNCFSNLLELDVLNLKNNRLTGIIPNISNDQRCFLEILNLNGNQLQGKLPEALSNCRNLEVLDVGNNRLSGPFPYSHLDILSNLRVLVLRSNNFSGSLSNLCNASAPVLQIIDVASNSFSGTLPADCFSGLNALMSGEADGDSGGLPPQFIKYNVIGGGYYQATVTVTSKGLELELMKITDIFKSLDLSNNKLEGEIPKRIGDLKLLRVLNMSHNYLEGQIPASIGNSRQLESIDLSRNQLSGRIPLELNGLTFLEVVNLSYNQLVGSIATGPQFSTFNNDSFIGNPELCGQPLSRKCENSSEKQGVGGSCSGSSPVNWLLISAQVRFTVGLGIVFGPLLFCRKWRMWYFKQIDMMLEYLTELWYYYFI
ncbi:hypothetical protein ACLOJK_029421 [Asimina triloba]